MVTTEFEKSCTLCFDPSHVMLVLSNYASESFLSNVIILSIYIFALIC